MYKITIDNRSFEISVNEDNPQTGTVNGKPFAIEIVPVKRKVYQVTYNDISYFVLVKNFESFEKILTLQVNHQTLKLKITDEVDLLLKNLGIDYSDSLKVKEVKAPMPGLVLDVVVEKGSEVKKGDNLLVLEAMKMENNIKSPSDGIVKSIAVTKGNAVEKNELLVSFD
ncbi:MAG: acetyl-CoA carboxylase biotin carboxyl carrier protein subunit [Bacteroidales bacterium]|nr:acetyl-CoA carboxylase biotin carboxyl carrier protein subunit [Bacteroidales bacterium]